jgi:membrane protease YdiL (CAAX protease family)
VSDRPPGPTRGRLVGWLALVGVLAALNYASRYAVEDTTGTGDADFFYRWDTFVGGVVQLALMGGLVYWIVRRGPAARLLALHRPSSWHRAAGAMLLVFVGILILGAALSPLLHPGEEQGLVPDRWHPEDAPQFGANLGLTALGVPLVEEMTFRGAGFSLLARYGRWVAIVGTAVLFGVAHGLVLALPILVAFGIGLAWIRSRSGSIYPGMLVHAAFNALAVLVGTFV